jgi:hypothetical protein
MATTLGWGRFRRRTGRRGGAFDPCGINDMVYEAVVGTLSALGLDTGAPTVCGNDQGPCGP